MSKKTTKKIKNTLALAVIFVVAAFFVFSIVAFRQINQQSLDNRSDAAGGEALVANITRFEVLNGPYNPGAQYQLVQGFPIGTAYYIRDGGQLRFRADYTSGWTPVLVYKVNTIEKFRYIGTDIAGRFVDYADPLSTYYIAGNVTVETFMNLRKVVGNIVYTCKTDSKMYQHSLGTPEVKQTLVPGATCVNPGIRTIRFMDAPTP